MWLCKHARYLTIFNVSIIRRRDKILIYCIASWCNTLLIFWYQISISLLNHADTPLTDFPASLTWLTGVTTLWLLASFPCYLEVWPFACLWLFYIGSWAHIDMGQLQLMCVQLRVAKLGVYAPSCTFFNLSCDILLNWDYSAVNRHIIHEINNPNPISGQSFCTLLWMNVL